MADNKANTPHPPQSLNPNPETPEAMPVKASIYRTLADFNAGFEQVIQSLGTLNGVKYLASENVRAMHNHLRRLRAQANREFMTVLNQREAANDGYFGSLGSLTGASPQPGESGGITGS